MTTQEQKNFMSDIFGAMMMGGHFKDQYKMASILKGIHYLLGSQEGLTSQECDNCLLYFFQNYSMGCKEPLTDSYIRSEMIPIVKNFPSMDIQWALSLIMAVKMK